MIRESEAWIWWESTQVCSDDGEVEIEVSDYVYSDDRWILSYASINHQTIISKGGKKKYVL